ncbi:hypothetical protein OH687_09820 [Burkholderia anthina]|nr:hypothetical protein OH687_09820 [Burkholderia anthina]
MLGGARMACRRAPAQARRAARQAAGRARPPVECRLLPDRRPPRPPAWN